VYKAEFTGPLMLAVALTASFSFCIHAEFQSIASDPLTFEVASVKVSTAGCPPECGLVRPLPGNRVYHAEGATLRSLMTIAYQVTDRQISGGPGWLGSDRFNIDAKADRPRTSDELHAMLAHLLEERFQLKIRRENRQESVMALVVDKGGSKMPLHDAEDKDYPPIGGRGGRGADGLMCGGLDGHNVMMNYFAFYLSRVLGKAVIDRTGLPARYDVSVQFAPDLAQLGPEGAAMISPDCPDISLALPKQLGLKLEPARGPVEYLVVEHAEKPTEN
jgi:uncharacterized protein (TIGR03435 family)